MGSVMKKDNSLQPCYTAEDGRRAGRCGAFFWENFCPVKVPHSKDKHVVILDNS